MRRWHALTETERTERVARGLLIVAIAWFVASLARHVRFVPFWDSGQYTDCLMDAVRDHSLAGLNCFKHPTAGYLSLLAIPQLAFAESVVAMHVTNIVLGVAAILAFHSIAKRITDGAIEASLAAATFAVMPMFGANVIGWTPDYGVLVFFLLFLAALAADRPLWAGLFGVGLVLSKESGMLMYGVSIVSFALVFFPRRTWRAEDPSSWRRFWPLLAPPLAAAIFLFGGAAGQGGGGGGLWHDLTLGRILLMMARVGLDRGVVSQAAALFVMSFMWVPTLVAGAYAASRLSGTAPPGPGRRLVVALAVTLIVGFIALTRFPTFNHPRYLLALFPFVPLMYARTVCGGVRPGLARVAAFLAVIVLFAASSERTIDPVSKRMWGTFPFGAHDMLRVTGLSGDCCGYGLDGLVYNLEFIKLDALMSDVLQFFDPDPEKDIIVVPAASNWYLLSHLDPKTHRRTIRTQGSDRPRLYSVEAGRTPLSGRRYLFIAMPTTDAEPARERVSKALQLIASDSASWGHYWLEAAEYRPRIRDTSATP